MIKVVGLIKRRSDISLEEFRRYWLEQHSKLERASLSANRVQRIVVSFFEESLKGVAPFDGMVELYYSSREEMLRAWSGDHDEVMRNDEANFCSPDFRVFFVADEVEIGRNIGVPGD
ncbi:EthD domain-containing protein (plasmid) [Cupriavidus necator]|uniref:EthD family reductase n=1 Tax=Cupriavidus necator TaxID=106590 RepID=A0A367P8B6_CUPNE|nr:EthD domain-containing protein [Cupriavidus necator]QQX89550.1 EthD domain-containing protein [Cupriavidus necator]RCJ04091.1 EthD family reductase [Cupriavidus necator]